MTNLGHIIVVSRRLIYATTRVRLGRAGKISLVILGCIPYIWRADKDGRAGSWGPRDEMPFADRTETGVFASPSYAVGDRQPYRIRGWSLGTQPVALAGGVCVRV